MSELARDAFPDYDDSQIAEIDAKLGLVPEQRDETIEEWFSPFQDPSLIHADSLTSYCQINVRMQNGDRIDAKPLEDGIYADWHTAQGEMQRPTGWRLDGLAHFRAAGIEVKGWKDKGIFITTESLIESMRSGRVSYVRGMNNGLYSAVALYLREKKKLI